MALSKKDYVAVAHMLAVLMDRAKDWPKEERQVIERIGHDMAMYFASQSQAFDRARFLKACGIDRTYENEMTLRDQQGDQGAPK